MRDDEDEYHYHHGEPDPEEDEGTAGLAVAICVGGAYVLFCVAILVYLLSGGRWW